MTVAQLIAQLKTLPQDCTVIVTQHSDYTEADGASVIEAVPAGHYIMRVWASNKPSMGSDIIAKVKDYVFIG